MNLKEKNEWISTLKEGDKVAVYNFTSSTPLIQTVVRFTKTCVVLDDRLLYYKNGGASRGSGRYTIRPLTPEILERVKVYDIFNYFRYHFINKTVSKLSEEQLIKLYDIVKEMERENNE